MSESIIVFRGRRVRIPGDSSSIMESIERVEVLMENTESPAKREQYRAVRQRLMVRLARALWEENGLYDDGNERSGAVDARLGLQE
jgi:hypothetical protein